MSYCRNCGAYIPDTMTKCLSCGYDETAQSSASQQQTQTESKTWRDAADEDRRRKIEEARKWAEEEHRKFVQQQSGQTGGQSTGNLTSSQRAFSVMSYIFALCVVPYIVCSDDKFVMYHARQGVYLFIIELIATFIGVIPLVGGIAELLILAYAVYAAIDGIKNASNGRMCPLKGVGEKIESLKRH